MWEVAGYRVATGEWVGARVAMVATAASAETLAAGDGGEARAATRVAAPSGAAPAGDERAARVVAGVVAVAGLKEEERVEGRVADTLGGLTAVVKAMAGPAVVEVAGVAAYLGAAAWVAARQAAAARVAVG